MSKEDHPSTPSSLLGQSQCRGPGMCLGALDGSTWPLRSKGGPRCISGSLPHPPGCSSPPVPSQAAQHGWCHLALGQRHETELHHLCCTSWLCGTSGDPGGGDRVSPQLHTLWISSTVSPSLVSKDLSSMKKQPRLRRQRGDLKKIPTKAYPQLS